MSSRLLIRLLKRENGGAVENKSLVAEAIKKEIIKADKELKKLDVEDLVNKRYEKFRNMGEYIGG